jgi:tetratricopeptide (TPR) repeat protein
MRVVGVLGGLLLALSAWAAPPQVLIVQRPDPRAPADSEMMRLDMLLAEVIDKGGRVIPVVWSESDPLFRSYAEERLVSGPNINPTDGDIVKTARNINAKYVITLSATLIDGKLYGRATLNQTGRNGALWTYGKNDDDAVQSVAVTVNGEPDTQSSLRALAATMNEQINSGPWKDLTGRPVESDPTTTTDPGTTFVEAVAPPPIVDAAASKAVMEQAQKYIEGGRTDMAILLLKDAIDLEPFEPKRRILLIELLSQQGLFEQAADEGRRAARLSVESADLWLAAARCWMLAGKPDEARADIQEALARGADGFLAQRLMGDLKLLDGKLPEAIECYQKAIAFEDRFQARIGLAIAYALSGQKAEALKVLSEAKATEGPMSEENYTFTVDLIDLAARELCKRLSNLLPAIRMKGKEMAPDAMQEERQATSLAEILSMLPPPALHAPSHEERVLAHKLLSQSTLEMLAFARDGNTNDGDESVLNLAEATRILGNVRELYRSERTYGPQPIPPGV